MAREKSSWELAEEAAAMEDVVVGTKIATVFWGHFGDVLSINESAGEVVKVYKNCRVLVKFASYIKKMKVRRTYNTDEFNYSFVETFDDPYSSTKYYLIARDGEKVIALCKGKREAARALENLKVRLTSIASLIKNGTPEQQELATKFVEEYLNLQKKDVQNEQ